MGNLCWTKLTTYLRPAMSSKRKSLTPASKKGSTLFSYFGKSPSVKKENSKSPSVKKENSKSPSIKKENKPPQPKTPSSNKKNGNFFTPSNGHDASDQNQEDPKRAEAKEKLKCELMDEGVAEEVPKKKASPKRTKKAPAPKKTT